MSLQGMAKTPLALPLDPHIAAEDVALLRLSALCQLQT
jgi:hypothetical protein